MMEDVSTLRRWIMRAMYAVMAFGIGATMGPLILANGATAAHMTGVAWALLGTIGVLSLLGLRYPVRMLPLLLFELTWKAIWLTAFALPHWRAGTLDAAMRETVFETALGGILLLVIPWGHVWRHYVLAPAERWR